MDSQRKSFILLITIFLSLFLQSPTCQAARSPNSPPLPPLVKQLCAKNVPTCESFCIKKFESDKRTRGAKTIADLTKIFISIGENDAKHAAKIISGLAKKEGVTPKSKEAIEMCANSYNRVATSFNSAIGYVKDGEYQKASEYVLFSSDYLKICQNDLSNAKLSIKAISDAFDVTWDFINVGLTFTSILLHGML